MDESKIVTRAIYELNASTLEQQYALLRNHLASEAGQLTVGAAFAAEREQYLSEKEAADRQQRFEAQVRQHETQNVNFIASTVQMLPYFSAYSGGASFPNTPENYLPAIGALDRTIFLPHRSYDFDPRNRKGLVAWYVVGANTKRGLIVCRDDFADDDKNYVGLIEGRRARKAARHFSQIPGNLNQQALAGLYDPESDSLKVTEENGHTLTSYSSKILSRIDDATMEDFKVPIHLMHLTALFGVRKEWEEQVLDEYTSDVSGDQIAELKEVAAQLKPQELPPS